MKLDRQLRFWGSAEAPAPKIKAEQPLQLQMSTSLMPLTDSHPPRPIPVPTIQPPYFWLLNRPDTGGLIREIDLRHDQRETQRWNKAHPTRQRYAAILDRYSFVELHKVLQAAGLAHPTILQLSGQNEKKIRTIRLTAKAGANWPNLPSELPDKLIQLGLKRIFQRGIHQLRMLAELNKLAHPKLIPQRLNILTVQVGRESDFNPESVSPSGALGLHQMMPYSYLDLLQRKLLNADLYPTEILTKLRKLHHFREFIPTPSMTRVDLEKYIKTSVIVRTPYGFRYNTSFSTLNLQSEAFFTSLTQRQRQNLLMAFSNNLRSPTGPKDEKFANLSNTVPKEDFPLLTAFRYPLNGRIIRCQLIFEDDQTMRSFFAEFREQTTEKERARLVKDYVLARSKISGSIYATLLNPEVNTQAGITFLGRVLNWNLGSYYGGTDDLYEQAVLMRIAELITNR